MTTYEKSYAEDRVMLHDTNRMMSSLSNFLKKFFQAVGVLAGAMITLVLGAYLLHWLHLK